MSVPLRQIPPADLARGRLFTPRQQDVLDGLEGIFLRDGFRQLTIEQLAARLRCSRRTLYELAPSKEELVLLVVDRLLRRIGREAMAKQRGLDDPIEKIHAYASTASVALRLGTPAFSADVAAHPATYRLFGEHYRFATSVIAHLIQQGTDRGLLRGINPQLVAEVLRTGLERLEDPDVLRLTGLTNAEAMQQLFDLIVFGLARGARERRTAEAFAPVSPNGSAAARPTASPAARLRPDDWPGSARATRPEHHDDDEHQDDHHDHGPPQGQAAHQRRPGAAPG
jgi:AcrR family transcriptional regulator